MKASAGQFAVEVRCPTSDDGKKGKVGSGFYIAPGLILTAAHTMTASEKPERDPEAQLLEKAIVRLLATRDKLNGMFTKGKGWVRATRVWPAGDDYPNRDVVLLSVDHDKFAQDTIAHNDWQWRISTKPQEQLEEEVTIFGYPDYAKDYSKAEKSSHGLRKMHGLLTKLEEGHLPYLVLASNSPSPKNASGWSALSGAAVLKGNNVVGVVKSAITEANDAKELEVEPMAKLRNDPAFMECVNDILASEKKQTTLSELVRPETVDRGIEIMNFGDALAPAFAEAATRHFVILQEGHERDDLSNCIDRYCREVIDPVIGVKGALAQHYSTQMIVNLESPSVAPQTRLKSALRNWADYLASDLPAFGPPETFAQIIRENANAENASRLLVFQHDVEELTKGCVEVLKGLLEVLSALEPASPPFFAFIKLCTGEASEPEDSRVRKIFYEDKSHQIAHLVDPNLRKWITETDTAKSRCAFLTMGSPGDCERSDLEKWLAKAKTETGIDAKDLTGWSDVSALMVHAQVPQRTAIDGLKKLVWEEPT